MHIFGDDLGSRDFDISNMLGDEAISLEPSIIANKLISKGGVKTSELPGIILPWVSSAFKSDSLKRALAGLEEGSINIFKVLVISRWIEYLQHVKPTISTIAKYSHINRNSVSTIVKLLDSLDLVESSKDVRSQLILPTHLSRIYIDVLSGNLTEEHDKLERVLTEIRQNELTEDSIKYLEGLETAFHLVKLAYDETTFNYEIMDELHNRVREIVVKTSSNEKEEVIDIINSFLQDIDYINKVREKAKKLGLPTVILEDTKERLGRARIFRVRSS
jgi:hypothetical protein